MSVRQNIVAFCACLTLANCTDVHIDVDRNSEKPDITSDVSDQYNILFIMTDDHAAQAIGTYGGRLAALNPTPNIDAFASEGMVFENVFVTNSICTPSRATVLTGQYSQTNGVLDLQSSLSADKQLLPMELSNAGYQTAIIGKWHLKEEPSVFDYYEVLPGQGSYFDPSFRVRGTDEWPLNTTEYVGHSSDVITDLSIEWLKNRATDKPFFLMHHFKAPHDFFEYAERYNNYLDGVMIPEPDDLYGVPDTFGSPATRGYDDSLMHEIGSSISKRNPRRNYGQHYNIDPSLPDDMYTHQAYQTYVREYLRTIKGVDDNIARLMQTLKDEGLYENTIIIYTSDQGMMLGEHDYQDKRWMWEESIQMPFIVRHPGIENAGQRSDVIINNTDFAPFILDLAGIDTPSYMHGRSFASVLSGTTPDDWRTASLYRYWTHRMYHDVPAHTGIRTKDHKLIFFYGDNYRDEPYTFYDTNWLKTTGKEPNKKPTPAGWEMYDLSKDPHELVNVYNDPAYTTIVETLKAELLRQRALYDETDKDHPRMQKIFNDNLNL